MIIRHKRFLDVCFEVVKVYPQWNKYRGHWINMGYVKSWYLDHILRTIKIEDLSDWEKCMNTEVDCLRYTAWRSL
jgi:hypothetical protein